MRVVHVTRDAFASQPLEPRRVVRVTPVEGGIDLHVVGLTAIAYDAIQAVSVCQAPDGLELVLILAGQARPFHASATQVSFREFPFPHRPAAATNLRGLVFHLLKNCPELVIDTGTADFLEGQPVQRVDRLREHASALHRTVAV